MIHLPDHAIDHLRQVLSLPDLSQTRYRLVERIGAGGMGVVYLAEDLELQRPVALKVLKEANPDRGAVDRMLREARVVAQLEHPGIVPIHDVGRLPDGRLYYVMRRVRGRRLDEHFGPEATVADRLRVFERICETVAFAHAQGVVHRDLKPQNVMVGPFGEVLVLDWGTVKLLRGASAPADHGRPVPRTDSQSCRDFDPDETRTAGTTHGTIVGTPAYMSPEQARGDVDAIDERTDVYGLGAILHFLLAGRPPAAARDGDGLSAQVPGGLALPVVQPQGGALKLLSAICRRAMAPASADRYASAADLRADVLRFLDGEPVAAYSEGVVERVGRFVRRFRTAILLIVAYLVMRAAFALFWPTGDPAPDRRAAPPASAIAD